MYPTAHTHTHTHTHTQTHTKSTPCATQLYPTADTQQQLAEKKAELDGALGTASDKERAIVKVRSVRTRVC